MKPLRRAGSTLGWIALAWLVAAAGCMDEPVRPEVPAARILGHVRTGGVPVDGTVVARRVRDASGSTYSAEARPDSSGLYAVDVPAGRYTLELQVRNRWYYGSYTGIPSQRADTLRLNAGAWPTTIDFNLATVTVEVTLSHALDGQWAQVTLHDKRETEGGRHIYPDQQTGKIEDGRLHVVMPGVLPTEYQVELELPSPGEHVWLPGTHDPSASPWQTVEVNSDHTFSCQLATTPARIEGRLAGASQAMGLPRATCYSLCTPDSLPVVDSHEMENDGSFSIPIHVPGPVKLAVLQNGVEHWVGGTSFATATVYTLRSGETISGIESVDYGLFIDLDCADAYPGTAYFDFYDATSMEPVTSAILDLSPTRQIGVANLWPGRYLLRVSRSSYSYGGTWRSQWFDRATDAAHAQVIDLSGATFVVPLRLVLERGGAIAGRCLRSTGPTTVFDVFLTPATQRICTVREAAFSPQYTFSIIGLEDGDYKVGVCPIGSWDWEGPPPDGAVWYPGTADWQQAAVVSIRDANTVGDVVIPAP